MNKKRDVKFIIYQSLYIFVVCVVAIKGADLGLTEVIDLKHGWAYTDTINNVIIDKTKFSQMMIVDTNNVVVVPKELLKENEKLQQIVASMPPNIDLTQYINKSELEKYELKTEKQKEQILEQQKEIVIGNVDLYQYHTNSINNQGDNAITINGVTIAPHSSGKVIMSGEASVVISAGNVSRTVSVKENKKPQLSWQRLTAMDENTKVTNLQRTTCYRLTINDDFPEQLEVKITGPVTWKKVSENVYDITMNAFGSKTVFDNYTENKESPYQLGFNVTVKDKIAPHSITGQQSFVFGEW